MTELALKTVRQSLELPPIFLVRAVLSVSLILSFSVQRAAGYAPFSDVIKSSTGSSLALAAITSRPSLILSRDTFFLVQEAFCVD